MIRIVINHDGIAAPVPIAHIRQIERRYTPIPVVEPKPVGTAAGQMPHMARPESARPTAVLERMIQVKLRGVTALVVPYPLTVGMHVGRFGVTFLIAEISGSRSFLTALFLTALFLTALFLMGWLLLLARRLLLLPRGRRSWRGPGPTRRSVTAAYLPVRLTTMLFAALR